MRSKQFLAPVPATHSMFPVSFKGLTQKLAVTAMALVAVLFSAEGAKAQTLTVNGAAADLYSSGFANLGSTQVGVAVTQNLVLKATGGTVTITSYSTPNPANLASGAASRVKQFTVGALTGCTTGTAIATNGTCTIPVTFTPTYIGYQTSPLTVVTNRGTFQFGLNGVGVGPQAILLPGVLSTIAGNGKVGTPATTYTGDGGQATAATVSSHGFAFDALGNLYEAEFNALAIRKITAAGVISTVAGSSGQTACATPTTANSCGDTGQATAATFSKNLPDVAFDSAGNYYIADLGDNKVRRVDAVSGVITTIAGTGTQSETGDGAAATAATLNTPEAVLVDSQDNIYILDSNAAPQTGTATPGATVRLINHTTGIINTVAGVTATPCVSGAGNVCGDGGQATKANIGVAASFYLDPITDNLWIADRDANRIRFVNAATAGNTNSLITTIAGTGATGYTGDGGAATAATFNAPHGIWVDPAGDLYISDRGNNVVRFVSSASGKISTLAGGGGTCTPAGSGSCGDGGPANGPTANINPNDLRLDVFGNLYVADGTNNAIRKIIQNPTTLTFPTVAVGVTSGPLTASLVNIGTTALTYTTPAAGNSNAAVTTTGPTAVASKAFAQTNATTCGPIYSTSTSGNTLASGAACNFVVSFTPDTAAGNYTGTLIETDNSAVSTTQVVNLAGAATVATATVGVTTSVNPSTYGQNVVVTATLSGAGVPPTGTVTFTYTPAGGTATSIGTGTISTTGGVTTAAISDALLPVGTDSIVATYSGDGNYVAGTKSSAVAQVVNLAPASADTLTATPPSTVLGASVALLFSIPTTTGATAPTGSVTFSYTPQGSTTPVTLGTVAALTTGTGASTATLSTTALPVGVNTITATYTGDKNYAAATPTAFETVSQTNSGVTITSSPNPSTFGQGVTISSTVTGTTPTGTVTFYQVGTPQIINMQATGASTTKSVTLPLAAGTYSISFPGVAGGGLYNGWAPANGGTSWTDRYGVELCANCATSIVVLPNNPSYTSDTAALAAYQSGATVNNGTTPTGNPFVFTLATAQSVSFYVPDGTFANGAFTDTSSFGDDSGGISLAVTPLTAIGTGTLNAAGVASITTTTLPVGKDTLQAVYSGDANNVPNTSSPTTVQVVNPAGGPNTDTLTTSNASPYVGQPVTFTDSIPQFNGICPTGPVTFSYTTSTSTTPVAITSTAAITPASPATTPATCVATVTTSSLPLGTDTVVASFPADTNYAASTSNNVTETVAQVSGATDAVTAANSTTTVGTADPLTFSVPVVTGVAPPAGTVVFTSGSTNLGSATWPATPTTGTCPSGSGTCYLLAASPSPTNIPLPTAPATSTPITATFTATTASGYASAAPTTSVVVVPQGGSGDTLTVANNPTTFGTSDTLTFNIPVTSGAPAPAGTVVFSAGGVALGSATWPASPTATGGFYSLSLATTALPVGSPTVVTGAFTATAASGYGSATPAANVTVNKVPLSADGISASPSATTSGQTVTLTFTVPNVNSTAATGTVTFTYNGATLGTGNLVGTTANGVTTFTTTTNTLPVGTDTITGTYTGDGNYAGGALTTPEAVSSNAGNYTVTASPSPTTVGSSDTLTFIVPVVAGAAAPTGSVTFVSGSTTLGTATFPATPVAVACPSGTGTCYILATTTTALPLTVAPATSTPVQATYTAGGTSGYGSGSANTTVVVNQVSGAADAVTAANSTTTVGTADPLTFSIPVVAGVPVPTGSVSFTSGSTNLGSATWPATPSTGACPTGGGTCYLLADSPSPTNIPLTVAPATSTPVSATYTAGSASGYASTTATTTVVVNAVTGTGDLLTVANNPTTFGTSDTLTFQIPVVSGAPAPAGTVTFTSGAVALGTATWPANPTPTNGYYTISVATTAIPVGAPTTVSAAFVPVAGSGYGAGTATAPVTVNKVPLSNDGISATPSAATSGTTVTLSFTVPNVNNTPPAAVSTVTFTYNGTILGAGAVTGTTANGVTTYTVTTTTLPVGNDTVTGTFTGDGNYTGGALTTPVAISSNSTTDTVVVATKPTTVALPDVITFNIPVVNGAAAPTGSVVFTSGTTTLGTGTWPATPVAVGGFYLVSITTSALPLTVAPATSTPVLATYTSAAGSGYASATATTTVVVNQIAGTNDAVTAANSTITVGSADALTFSIPVVTGAPVPTGTVVFVSGTTALGTATWPATPTTGTCPGGTGTCYLLLASPSPTNIPLTVSPATTTPITATYTAGSASGYASALATTAVDVTPVGGTGGTLTVANNPTTYGTADTLTFSIPATNGVPPPAGTIVFTAGSGAATTALGTATWPANPVAVGGFYTISVSPTNIPVGSPTPLTATFTPSAGSGYGASAPTANVTVNKVPVSSDSISASPNPANFGATVTLTFSVPTANSTPPVGSTVTFTNGATVLGTPNVTGVTANGVTTYTTTTTVLPVGSDTVTGTFTGDGNYAGGALTTTEVINPVGGTAGLTATPNPTTFGTLVTLTETIAAVNGTCPSGPATFLNNGVSIGNAPVVLSGTSCVAVLTTSTLPVGTDPITVTVPASGGFSAIASGPVNVVIGKNPGTGDVLTTSPNPSFFGTPVVVTETLVLAGGVAPTGSVTFYNNGTAIGTAQVVGLIATITTSALPAGTDPITATYTGDANYATVTSGPVQQVVNQNTSTATLAAGPNPATFGTLVTLTETIAPINGTCPAGPTTFYNNGASIGTGVITLTNGSCVATLTSTTLPVGTDSITATVPASGGFVATTTGPVALVINKANGPDTLASSPNPSVFGSPVTITDTIPILGGVAPTGTVTFYSFGVQIGTGTVNAQGVATFVTSTLPVGTDSLTATYAGDGNYAQVTTAPVNQVVTAVSTTTATLAVGPNPANFGTTVAITETIPVVNSTPPVGQVTFFYTAAGGTLIQIGPGTLVNGIATITTNTLPVGTDQITATWPGDSNYTKVSSGPVAEIINQANGPELLTVAPDPALFGAPVVITTTIPIVGGVAPTGTVTFYNNGVAIGTGTVNALGVATITTTTLPIGTDPITSTYNGDANYAAVTTGPVNETITQGNTIPVLGATPNPATFGTTVTLTEAIPGINGVLPTGKVTFFYNGTSIGTGTVVNGVATVTTSTLPIGTDPITATYTGDATYATAQSGPLNVVITKAAPTDTLTATPSTTTYASPVTLTFTVPLVNNVVPTGTVTFLYNGNSLGTGTVNASGVATLVTSVLPVGSDPLVAQYLGDNNYAPSAPTATATITQVTPVSVVTVPPGTPACGSSVTLTDTLTVNGVAIAPGGTVQFYDNGVAIGSPITVPASGIVTLSISTLPCTSSVITAKYTPPANSPYLPVTGGPTTINIQTPDFSITATPPNQTVNPGDTTTYTVSLSGVGAPFTSPVTLSVTGLPPGATVSFANPVYVPGAGPTTTTMTVVTSPTQAMLQHPNGGLNGIYYGLLLLPLLGVRGVRRKIRALPKGISYCLAALVLLGGLGAMTGCGGGYFGPAQQVFTLTISGTATPPNGTLIHSTTVTLTVR